MGLRCTVMGHDYGESQRTEEREERGDEVVVTVREYRECRRCSQQRTLSENTEVRSGNPDETGEATDPDETDGTSRPPESRGHEDTAVTPDRTTDAAVDRGITANEGTSESSFDHDTVDPSSEQATDRDDGGPTAVEDDGIILENGTDDGDDDEDPDDRTPGEWPDAAKEQPDGTTYTDGDDPKTEDTTGGGWPTPDAEDQGYDAKPTATDPEEEESVGDLADESAFTGETPTTRSDRTSGTTQTGSEPAARQPPSKGAVLSCPQCGHTAPSRASSLRPGDNCPECGDEYLAEREK